MSATPPITTNAPIRTHVELSVMNDELRMTPIPWKNHTPPIRTNTTPTILRAFTSRWSHIVVSCFIGAKH